MLLLLLLGGRGGGGDAVRWSYDRCGVGKRDIDSRHGLYIGLHDYILHGQFLSHCQLTPQTLDWESFSNCVSASRLDSRR